MKTIVFLDGTKELPMEHLFEKGDILINKKTKKEVIFESYYVTGMLKYSNESQNNIIGYINRFEKKQNDKNNHLTQIQNLLQNDLFKIDESKDKEIDEYFEKIDNRKSKKIDI